MICLLVCFYVNHTQVFIINYKECHHFVDSTSDSFFKNLAPRVSYTDMKVVFFRLPGKCSCTM